MRKTERARARVQQDGYLLTSEVFGELRDMAYERLSASGEDFSLNLRMIGRF
jgi:hypothetical protein